MSDTTTPSTAMTPHDTRVAVCKLLGKITIIDVSDGGFIPEPYTPDDMLAWLRGRRPDVAIEMWYDPEQDQPYWVHWWDGETPEQGAPTLHAALEAAVIAVGRAE